MRKCVFFDRDGIVNASPSPGYVTRWEDFLLLPGFARMLALAHRRGYVAVVVTNQRAVSRGIMTRETLEDIHARMREQLRREHGLELLDVLYCPHGEGECACRKPQPGMLLEAARRHGIDLAASWMVGDQAGDVEAGRRAGCRTAFVGEGPGGEAADLRAPDLAALERLLDPVLT